MKLLVCTTIFLTLISCRNSDKKSGGTRGAQMESLESKVKKLEGKMDRIELLFGDVTGSVLKLGNEIEDFSSENWRKNVPELEYEFEQLRQAVSDVQDEF